MKGHQAALPKLGFPDQQPISCDVGKSQAQRLGDAQPGASQQCKQGRVSVRSQRAAGVELSCGFDETVDLAFRVDVRGAALLAARKILRLRQFVPIILSADMAGKAADRLQSSIPLRRRWPFSGPVDRGLRTDMRFVPLPGEAGKTR